MRLVRAHLRDYRSIHDSGPFEIEPGKTLLVGVNEAGKTALLRSLQTINPPKDAEPLEALRDYPRARYTEIQSGGRDPGDVRVAEAHFTLDDVDRAALSEISPSLGAAQEYTLYRHLDNTLRFHIAGVPSQVAYADITKDIARLRAHLISQAETESLVADLDRLTLGYTGATLVQGKVATALAEWLETAYPSIDEDDAREEERYDRLQAAVTVRQNYLTAHNALRLRVPLFVYYSTYFTVRPRIHLSSFAAREDSGELDLEYDFGNQCLLKLLGFTARELADLASGAPPEVPPHHATQAEHDAQVLAYTKRLDDRQYRLNAASVNLTQSIREVWGDENLTLRLVADGQYLKVMVVDDLGVEVELDQRSEGFRWLVSFFVVFKSQAGDQLRNAILLLDEPGLSLHALKQQEFRHTVSRLGRDNQIVYTTHSPFMVGTDELDLVRIVEMKDRTSGTRVHTRLAVDDPRSVYPLQAALGYELAQSLFAQSRNLVCEGVTDMFYLEVLTPAFAAAGLKSMRENVALVPAKSASKVLYYCTLLTSQRLKVAALLDSDAAGEQAAKQEELVAIMKAKTILRTKDHYKGQVAGPELEDMLRETLVQIAMTDLGWDVTASASAQPTRRIIDIFTAEVTHFSKYRLAKAFIKWLSTHEPSDLTVQERAGLESLFVAINRAVP